MDEQEEFEFRHRLEQEQESSSVQPQAQQEETPWYSGMLNPAPKEMSWPERLTRVGEAGVGGMAVGGALGSVMPVVGTAGGAITGGIGGAGSEIYKQIASKFFDSTPLQQEIGGLAAGGIVPRTAGGALPILGKGLSYVGNYPLRRIGYELKNLDEPAQTAVSQAVRAAKERMQTGGNEAATDFGKSVLSGFQREMKAAEKGAFDETIRAQKQADALAKLKNSAADELEATYLDQAHAATQQYADKLKTGLPNAKDPYDVGAKMRLDAESIVNPKMAARQEAYKNSYNQWANAEKAAETTGQFWATSPAGLKAKDAILKLAEGRHPDIKSSIQNLVNDIWKPVTKEVPVEGSPFAGLGGMFQPSGTKTVTTIKPLEATAVEDIVRELGKVYEKDAPTGYAALKGGLDKQIRSILTEGAEKGGGLYDRFGLGEGKAGYKAISQELENFMNTSQGAKLLSKQFGSDFNKTGNQSAAQYFMATEDGLREAQRLFGDPKKVGEYVDQYVQGQIRGKTPKEVDAFLAKNPQFEKLYPDVIKNVRAYNSELSTLENNASQFTKAASGAEKMRVEPTQVEQIKPEVKDVLGIFNKGFESAPHSIVGKILSNDSIAPSMVAEASRLAADPKQAGNFIKAVGYELSSSSPQMIMQNFEKLRPALSNMRGVTPQHIDALQAQVQQVVNAAAKAKVDPKPLIKRIFSAENLTKLGISTAGAYAGGLGVAGIEPVRRSIFQFNNESNQRR